jgi:hypothetical protein
MLGPGWWDKIHCFEDAYRLGKDQMGLNTSVAVEKGEFVHWTFLCVEILGCVKGGRRYLHRIPISNDG